MFYDFLLKKRIVRIGLVLALSGSVAGCGASSAELLPDKASDTMSDAMGYTGDEQKREASYEVPIQLPGILVDQHGYSSESDKVAVFKGNDISGNFEVREYENGNIVYTGQILKPLYNNELDEYDCFGYFTEVTKPGKYYVYNDMLGQSYSFEIKEDSCRDIFDSACKKFYENRCGMDVLNGSSGEEGHSACHTDMAHLKEDPSVEIDVTGGWHLDKSAKRDVLTGTMIADNLILAYEMNPDAFTDSTGILESGNNIPDILDEVRYEAQWLLKMQEEKTGGVYESAIVEADEESDASIAPVVVTPISMDATISFASMMAKFSYFYQQYDDEFATTCLKAADRAWKCFLNNRDVMDDTAAFYAAAQLYRATGVETYHDILVSYFEREDFKELFNSDESIFLGSVTYLAINKNVDIDICTKLMKLLMKRSEEIAEEATTSTYLVADMGGRKDFSKMLCNMRALTITDHIIYNHEYTTIIENHVHYFGGTNSEAINYLTNDTSRNYEDVGEIGIMNNPEDNALLIFMLSVLVK